MKEEEEKILEEVQGRVSGELEETRKDINITSVITEKDVELRLQEKPYYQAVKMIR